MPRDRSSSCTMTLPEEYHTNQGLGGCTPGDQPGSTTFVSVQRNNLQLCCMTSAASSRIQAQWWNTRSYRAAAFRWGWNHET